jgi:hypothetical protein
LEVRVSLPAWVSAGTDDVYEEFWRAHRRHPYQLDVISGRHVDLEELVILVGSSVRKAQIALAKLHYFELSGAILLAVRGLTEKIHIVDVLPSRNEVSQHEVGSDPDEVLSVTVVLGAVTIHSNRVFLRMQGGEEVLGVHVPLGVEDQLVLDHICQEDDGSVLLGTPPRRIRINQALTVLICDRGFLVGLVSHRYGLLHFLVVRWLELVEVLDVDLGPCPAKQTEVDVSVEVHRRVDVYLVHRIEAL